MELRHLRYFVAVAEEGSLTVAAERRLHTAQPSLSRQIRDLEYEVGVSLMTRSARGIELTEAGRVFLEHARLALAQTEAAVAAARRAGAVARPSFALGFLTGQEMDWLPAAMEMLRGELPNVDVVISSQYSPELADGLMRGQLDVAFMRAEPGMDGLEYKVALREKLMVVLPSDHRLAGREAIGVGDVAGEVFIGMSKTAPALRAVIDAYLLRCGVEIRPQHEVDNIGMAVSLVGSTRGVALLPAYARNFLPGSLVSRPLKGEAPTIDLVIGYHRGNASAVLKTFLRRSDELIELVAAKVLGR
jgi:LysR family hca operon transcriptional activator